MLIAMILFLKNAIEHEERNIREGELFQINNNTCQHMVKNGSLIDRVHLLMDWLPTS